VDKKANKKINRNGKIAIGVAVFTVLALVVSIFLGDFKKIAPGAIVALAICYYFYHKRYEPDKERIKKAKKVNAPVRKLSLGNPPTNEPIAPGLEIMIDPADNLLGLLKNDNGYSKDDRWQGLSLKEVRDDLESGWVKYVFEYEPWSSQGRVSCPIDEVEDKESFAIYLDGIENKSSFMGYTDPIYSDRVREALIDGEGFASVYFYVYGGKCMFMNEITGEIETLDDEFQYLVRLGI